MSVSGVLLLKRQLVIYMLCIINIHDKEEFTKAVNKNEKGLYWRLSEEHRKLWCEYHGKNCMFQMLCITCHKNKTNEER